MTVTWHLSDGRADNNFTNELYSLRTSRHLVSDKCSCHVTCPKDECFSNFTATSEWLVTWWHQAITWNNVDFSFEVVWHSPQSNVAAGAQVTILYNQLKILPLKLLSRLPGASELNWNKALSMFFPRPSSGYETRHRRKDGTRQQNCRTALCRKA